MRQGWLWVILGGVALLLIGLITGLYLLGGDHQSPLERLRDISLVFITIGIVLFIMLMAGLVGAVVWLVLLLKDKVVPLLEQLNETAARVHGTTTFVSEEVAKPVISTASTIAGLRAMIRTVTTGTDRKPRQSSKDDSAGPGSETQV